MRMTDPTDANRRRRRLRPLWLLAVGLLAAGCGSAGAAVSGGASTGGRPPANAVADAYKYSSCMRTHGVENFPDPVVSSSQGHSSIRISIVPGAVQSPQFAKASKACRALAPGHGSQQTQSRPPLKDELDFAECMRSHGYASFPDPTTQGQLSVQMVISAGIDVHAPGLRTAALACVPASHGALTRAAIVQALAQGASS
jgi:hypothetical protein